MAKVVMEGWREGLKKVSLTLLQTELLKLSLKAAKSNVDLLLDDVEIVLHVEDVEVAKEFCIKAEEIGVVISMH